MNEYKDRGIFLVSKMSSENNLYLKILTEKNKLLFNQYGITMVNQLKCPNTNSNDAKKFINWLISPKGQDKIKNFKVKNQQLFFPNAN